MGALNFCFDSQTTPQWFREYGHSGSGRHSWRSPSSHVLANCPQDIGVLRRLGERSGPSCLVGTFPSMRPMKRMWTPDDFTSGPTSTSGRSWQRSTRTARGLRLREFRHLIRMANHGSPTVSVLRAGLCSRSAGGGLTCRVVVGVRFSVVASCLEADPAGGVPVRLVAILMSMETATRVRRHTRRADLLRQLGPQRHGVALVVLPVGDAAVGVVALFGPALQGSLRFSSRSNRKGTRFARGCAGAVLRARTPCGEPCPLQARHSQGQQFASDAGVLESP